MNDEWGIYRHFDTKIDLAKAAYQYSYEVQIKSNFEFDERLSPKEKLLTIFKNYQKMALKPVIPEGCPILNTAIEVDDTDETFRKHAQANIEEVINMIGQILEEGKKKGEFIRSIDSRKEAQLIFASIEGAIMLSRITRNKQPLIDTFERMIAFLEVKVFL